MSIEPASYELFVNEARENLLKQQSASLSHSRSSSPDPFDEAEAKAEELFLKAKAAFQRTGQKASAALKDLKESDLAKRSLDQINRFVKELTTPKAETEAANGDEEDDELARAVQMSVVMDEPLIRFEEDKTEDSAADDSGVGTSQ